MADLSLLFTLKAKNEAAADLKSVERQISSLKDRIKEIRAESKDEIGFKAERIKGAQSRLKDLTDQYKALKETQAQSKRATEEFTKSTKDAADALGVISPRLGSTLGALGGAAGPMTVVALGLAAVTAAGIALQKGLFDLAVSAADFRGKLLDMSQQTGVSVETLSALEVAAARVGTSIEGIVQPLIVFQKHLDDAQDPASAIAKKFAELGVSTNNTEDALRQTLAALAKMPEGFKQTALAAELFGRGGRTFLAILKETHGDIDELIDKLRELGVVVSTEDARAADEFNDQLAILQFQMRGLLGKEVIPAALQALKDLSQFLKDNKRDIDAVAHAAGTLATVFGTTLKISLAEAGGLIRAANEPYVKFAEVLERIVAAMKFLRGNIPAQSLREPEGQGRITFNPQPQNVGGGETDTRIHQPLTDAERDAAQERERLRKEAASRAKQAAAERRRELENQLKALQNLNIELAVALDIENKVDTKTREYAVSQSILTGELSKADEGLKAMMLTIAKSIDAANKRVELDNRLTEFQKEQNEAVREAIEGEKGHIKVVDDFIAALEKEGRAVGSNEEFWLRFNAAILANVDARKMLAQTIEDLPVVEVPGTEGKGLSDDEVGALAGAAANAELGAPPEVAWAPDASDAFGSLGEAISNVLGLGKEGAEVFGGMLTGAFSSLANAVGDAVAAFVLFGGAGVGLKKFTAEVIAQIARMAAVQAIWELAQGLAMLALNFFWPDPKLAASATAHFHAAAVYGGLAAVAAVAGRAVAGGAFAQGGAGAGNAGRNPSDVQGGGANGSQSSQPVVFEQQRNQQPQVIILRLESNDSHIVRVVGANVRQNGPLREILLTHGS